MAEEEEDKDSKTEDPTPRRLEEAVKQGQVINSREVTNLFIFTSLCIMIYFVFPFILKEIGLYLKLFISNLIDINISENNSGYLLKTLFLKFIFYGFLPLGIIVIAVIFSAFLQRGEIRISTEPLLPNINRLSLVQGFHRIFSIRSFVEFAKNITKILLVFIVIYFTIISDIQELKIYHEISFLEVVTNSYNITGDILLKTCIAIAFLAILDYLYQRYEYLENLKMSKQDLKEEFKQTEGNPEVKKKQHKLRLERVKYNINISVPKADVVITNPTHFAVALKYDEETMGAPTVIAKGQDAIALSIRNIAEKHEIPIVENPSLARVLYYNVKIDEEIPLEHYKAVAEIISYIYKIKKKPKHKYEVN